MDNIQVENIGGRSRTIRFTQETTMLLQDTPIVDMDESERKAFGVQYIIWAGLKTNCAIKGERFTKTVPGDKPNTTKEVTATLEDVFAWVKELTPEVITDIVNLYAEVNKFREDLPPQGEKKSEPKENTEQNVIESPAAD